MDVVKQFDGMGYPVVTVEMQKDETLDFKLVAKLPVHVLNDIVETCEKDGKFSDWYSRPIVESDMHAATKSTWMDFTDVPKRVFRLWNEPILNCDGSLTESRNYDTYAWEMSNTTVINLKWNDIKQFVKTGKIVDEGCADGALLLCISKDFPDCDLIGVELTTEFLARCHERQRLGQFGSCFIFFHQRNITRPIFENNSIDTTICNSTFHELYSYSPAGTREQIVKDYVKYKFDQLRPNGRFIVRDVIGPEDKDKIVLMWINHKDGVNNWLPGDDQKKMEEYETMVQTQLKGHPTQLQQHLHQLSTFALFDRFKKDFAFSSELFHNSEIIEIEEQYFVKTNMRAAAEFMLTKDYHTNWESEMHETFTFWSLKDWKNHLRHVGFRVLKGDPTTYQPATRAYTNDWIIKNRFDNHCQVYDCPSNLPSKIEELKTLAHPPTNVIIVAEKPQLFDEQ